MGLTGEPLCPGRGLIYFQLVSVVRVTFRPRTVAGSRVATRLIQVFTKGSAWYLVHKRLRIRSQLGMCRAEELGINSRGLEARKPGCDSLFLFSTWGSLPILTQPWSSHMEGPLREVNEAFAA